MDEMSRPLLSVVIPIYNTEERYLKACFRTFAVPDNRIELVVVDDGSNLETRNVISRLLNEVRVKCAFVTKENGGQNSARQAGVGQSSGAYVFFLDSDDYVDPILFFKAVDVLETKSPDVLMFNVARVDDSGHELERYEFANETGDLTASKRELIIKSPTLCSQFFSRNLLNGYGLVLNTKIGEDMASAVPLIARAKVIYGMSEYIYKYVVRESSVTRNPLPEDAFAIIVAIDELKNRMPSGFSSELEWLAIKHVLFYGAERALKTFGYDPRVKHRLFGYMQTFFPHWRKNPYLQAETHNMRVAFRLLIRGNWRLYYMLSRCKALLRCA